MSFAAILAGTVGTSLSNFPLMPLPLPLPLVPLRARASLQLELAMSYKDVVLAEWDSNNGGKRFVDLSVKAFEKLARARAAL